jgi:hypothetical protein
VKKTPKHQAKDADLRRYSLAEKKFSTARTFTCGEMEIEKNHEVMMAPDDGADRTEPIREPKQMQSG